MCVVKAFRSSSLALKRTLSVYGQLRESGQEADAPVAPLLKVVRVNKDANKGKSKARATAKAKAKSTGSKGKVKFQGKNQRANKGRNTNKLTGNFTELWFEHMGADVAVKDQVEAAQYIFLSLSSLIAPSLSVHFIAHRSFVIRVSLLFLAHFFVFHRARARGQFSGSLCIIVPFFVFHRARRARSVFQFSMHHRSFLCLSSRAPGARAQFSGTESCATEASTNWFPWASRKTRSVIIATTGVSVATMAFTEPS